MKITDKINIDPNLVSGKECRHITYTTDKEKKHDALIVKEYIHLHTGEKIPNIRIIEDMERPFWVTKQGRRDHKDKLQWEHLDNVNEYWCREMDLMRKADLALGGSGYVKNRQLLFKSPYLYGCGVKPQSIIRNQYITKYPDHVSPFARVATSDTETDVLHGHEEIIMQSLTFKDKAFIAATRAFFDGAPDENIHERFNVKLKELLGETLEKRNCTVEFILCDNAGEIVKAILDKAHEWQPDFIEFWNMNFDINKMIEALDKYGYDKAECFSDPFVPSKYKFFKYKEGGSVKVTHDGRSTSINPEARWHVLETPAGFFFVDGMTLYFRVRLGAGNEDSYALDDVLQRNLDITKLKIDEIDHLTKIDWQVAMQRNYKYEYVVYNLFDCIALELLDEEIGDVSVKFPALSKNSDYTDFKSGPIKIADNMHYHVLKEGYVLGVIDGDISDDNDAHCLVSRDWIITLPSFMNTGLGVDIVEI